MAAPLPTLREKRDTRRKRRDRQYAKYKLTGKQGHLKAFKAHRRAIRKLTRLIKARVLLESRPSPNFSYAEFNCKDGTPVPRAAHKGLDHLCQNYLEPLRAKFGAIYVTSGFRHLEYNRAIRGASMSVHIYDYPGRDGSAVAADVVCRTGTPQQWGEFLAGIGADGIGVYNSSGFVHVDNRTRMGWPKSSGFGN
jgi:hypothetical protein